MTPELAAGPICPDHAATIPTAPAPPRFKTLRTLFAFGWKFLVGALLCQHPISSVLVVGWLLRLMQRHAWRQWWKASELPRHGISFDTFMAQDEQTRPHLYWPNWIMGPTDGEKRGVIRRLTGSLYDNAKLGLQGILNTWVLTLPGCGLWLSAWFAGWNNSFHKGYELAWVGTSTGMIGVGLFIVAMLYVPMAQARQAITGHWRAFYDFALIWGLIRRRWRQSMVLAGLYSLLSLPVISLLMLPAFFEHIWPATAALSDAEALKFLNTYHFRVGLLGFAVVVMLRRLAARFYATAVLEAVQTGELRLDEVSVVEQAALHRLQVQPGCAPPRRTFMIRTPLWMGARLVESLAAGVTMLLWFTFVAQIFISEFFNYHPIVGWLNQPLVQLPWFESTPPGFK